MNEFGVHLHANDIGTVEVISKKLTVSAGNHDRNTLTASPASMSVLGATEEDIEAEQAQQRRGSGAATGLGLGGLGLAGGSLDNTPLMTPKGDEKRSSGGPGRGPQLQLAARRTPPSPLSMHFVNVHMGSLDVRLLAGRESELSWCPLRAASLMLRLSVLAGRATAGTVLFSVFMRRLLVNFSSMTPSGSMKSPLLFAHRRVVCSVDPAPGASACHQPVCGPARGIPRRSETLRACGTALESHFASILTCVVCVAAAPVPGAAQQPEHPQPASGRP